MTTPIDATALVPSESSAAEQSRRELQARLNGLGGLSGRKLSAEAREKKLREACEGFESVFIQKMWQEMRNTIPKGGLMHGKEERFWQDMYDQELSKSMTSAGGIGLADMMYAQLSRNLVSASRSAAGAAQGRAFAPGAAPLLEAPAADPTTSAGTPASSPVGATQAAAIYDGAAPGVAAVQGDVQAGPVASAGAPASAPAAAVNGQAAQPVASAMAAQPGAAAEEAVELNPEVERALAALRARQALHHKEEAGQAMAQASPAASAPSAGAQGVAAAQRQHPMASSGIELAQVARREAGDKLGSHAVRPPLHQPSPRHNADAAQPAAQAAPVESALAATGETVAAAEAAQAAPRTRNVRVTTNMSAAERSKRGLKPIRVLNVDNVGVNSKAGAGLAAYHAANEAQAAAAQPAPLTAEAPQPAPGPATGPATAPATGQAEAAANFTIPPLTAADARG